MNKIFVIEGTDGTGKETQANQLSNALKEIGYNIYTKSFPNYEDLSSGPVKEYLNGNISLNPNAVSHKAASSFYAVDRYITFQKYILPYYQDESSIIVFDRYTQSNLIHQGSKLIAANKDENDLDSFLDWLYHFEYEDLELPPPTATIYLYAPIDFTLALTKDRTNKFSKEKEKDIHEKNIDHLLNASKAGMYYAKKQGWHIVECVQNNMMRPVSNIANEIFDIVQKYL